MSTLPGPKPAWVLASDAGIRVKSLARIKIQCGSYWQVTTTLCLSDAHTSFDYPPHAGNQYPWGPTGVVLKT